MDEKWSRKKFWFKDIFTVTGRKLFWSKDNNFKILHQLIKKHKALWLEPMFVWLWRWLWTKTLPWIFSLLTISSQRLQLPSGSLLIIIFAVADRSSMPVWFSQPAWLPWFFLIQAVLHPAADFFLLYVAEWF